METASSRPAPLGLRSAWRVSLLALGLVDLIAVAHSRAHENGFACCQDMAGLVAGRLGQMERPRMTEEGRRTLQPALADDLRRRRMRVREGP